MKVVVDDVLQHIKERLAIFHRFALIVYSARTTAGYGGYVSSLRGCTEDPVIPSTTFTLPIAFLPPMVRSRAYVIAVYAFVFVVLFAADSHHWCATALHVLAGSHRKETK